MVARVRAAGAVVVGKTNVPEFGAGANSRNFVWGATGNPFDPMLNPGASRFERISYLQVLEQGLKVMDATAISLCMDNRLPIVVFNLRTPGNIKRAITGEPIGSLVTA